MRENLKERLFVCDVKDLNRLQSDLKNFNNKVQNIIQTNGKVHVRTTEELTESESDLMESFINSFVDSDPEDKIPLIYDYAKAEAKNKHFHNINYKKELKVRLQRQSEIVQGEMRKVTWYRHMEYQTINGIPTRVYSKPVLKTETSWTRDASGFAIAKNAPVRTWYNRDGSENTETKVMDDPYYYEDFEQITEGKKRRGLLVNCLQKPVMHMMVQVLTPEGYSVQAILLKARAFMDSYDVEFSTFVDNSSTVTNPADPNLGRKTIVVALEDNSSDGRNKDYNHWLDKAPPLLGGLKTIRQYLIEEFSI